VLKYVQNIALVMDIKCVKFDENSINCLKAMDIKCVKFDENSINCLKAMTMSVFFKVLNGR